MKLADEADQTGTMSVTSCTCPEAVPKPGPDSAKSSAASESGSRVLIETKPVARAGAAGRFGGHPQARLPGHPQHGLVLEFREGEVVRDLAEDLRERSTQGTTDRGEQFR